MMTPSSYFAQNESEFLILWKYLLILGKSEYIWATLSQWDKYLVTHIMQIIDLVLTLGGVDFT